MSEYKTIPDDVLMHHGILGMHWGIRRYQNPDGTLTESGRKRYYGDYERGTLTKKGEKQYRKNVEFHKAHDKLVKEITDKQNERKKAYEAAAKVSRTKLEKQLKSEYLDYHDSGAYWKFKDENSDFHKRWSKNAELGLKATQYLDGNTSDIENPKDKEWQEWFMFEDQTIGQPEIAAMVNDGKSAKEIKEMIKSAEEYGYYDVDNYDTPLNMFTFGVIEGEYNGYLKRFADACEKVKNEQ